MVADNDITNQKARFGLAIGVTPVPTGRTGHATPSGSFAASRMEADHYSKEWDDAPLMCG